MFWLKWLPILMSILVVLCTTFPLRAQETDFSVRHKLPKVQANDSGEVCLNVDQWKQVLLVSSQNKGLFEWRLEVIGIVNAHEFITAKYEVLMKNYELQIKIQTQRIEYLTARVDQERKAARTSSLEDRIEKYAMWIVIIAETLIIGVMGVKMMVASPAAD